MSIDLAKLYPNGRTFFDESDDRDQFIRDCNDFDLCPAVNYPPADTGLEPFATVYVPAHRLEAFYALDLRVGT